MTNSFRPLSAFEQRVLSAVQLDASMTVAHVARLLGSRHHRVRYALDELLDRGVIYPQFPVDLSALGLSTFDLFFTLGLQKDAQRSKILQWLIDHDRVSLLSELGGGFEYQASICAFRIAEVTDLLEELGHRFGEIFFQKALAVRHSYIGFGRKYFANKPLRGQIELGTTTQRTALDDLDHRILFTLSRRRLKSLAEHARLLGVSSSSFDLRIKELQRRRVLQKPIYAVTPHLYGYEQFRILVFAKGISRDFHQRFYDFARRHPHIVNLVRSAGSWDYELGIEVPSARHLPAIARDLQGAFASELNELRTLPVFSYLKGCSYPLESRSS